MAQKQYVEPARWVLLRKAGLRVDDSRIIDVTTHRVIQTCSNREAAVKEAIVIARQLTSDIKDRTALHHAARRALWDREG